MTEAKVVSWHEWAEGVVRQLKGHQREIVSLRSSIEIINRKLEPVYAAYLGPRILETLRRENKPRSWRWIWHRFGHDAWDALKQLELKGLVSKTRIGSHTMYVAKES